MSPSPHPAVPPGFRDPDGPTTDDLVRCVRCGLCLASCPTYLTLGLETDSPRGRIHLMRAVGDGRLPLSDGVVKHFDQCLGCRACEPVCPSDVPYGRMLEAMRGVIQRQRPATGVAATIQRLALRRLLPSARAVRVVGRLLRISQRLGLPRFAQNARALPSRLRAVAALAPTIPDRFYAAPAAVIPAQGERRHRVALFVGCVMPVLFGPTVEDTQQVLTANGYDVAPIATPACCGALHGHAGDRDTARALARQVIDAYERSGALAMVVNSAGCGAFLKDYGHVLANDPAYAARAEHFSREVLDISEILARHPLRGPLGALPITVTYQDACHLAHGQRVRRPPRDLLRAIPGLRLVEMPQSDRCCGSAGIYNLTQPDIASDLLTRKVADIRQTAATVVVAGNPGCLTQIAAGLRAQNMPVTVTHTVSLLAESYRRARAEH